MKIRMAVTPPAHALGEAEFGAYLEACEALGFDTLWLSDIPLGALGDPLVSLAFAAGVTRRLKLGANVVPLGRNPLWLAKQLAQLDRLSGGRLLLSFVPGLGAPAERAALGCAGVNRGVALDEVTSLLRRFWAGEAVGATHGEFVFDAVEVAPRPLQAPLEIWFGGRSKAALERVARSGDGWLTAAATPDEAAAGRETIIARAAAHGRQADPEHFGISIPYSRTAPRSDALATLRQRRPEGGLDQIVAVGAAGLRDLIERHTDGGLSKFVLRPLDAMAASGDWRGELEWLAEVVLPLQT